MKKTVLALFFLAFGLAAQAQLAYTGDSGRNQRNPEVSTLQVFPNPTVDYFSISTNQSIERIAVFNMLGRQVKLFTFTEGDRYFVGDLPKGMYLVQMTGKDSRLISTQRLSKR